MEELVQIFLEESGEILQQLEEDLLELEKNPEDQEIIKRVFRAAHTIKGSAGLIGIEAISSLGHRMEDVLDQVRNNGQAMSRECFDTIFASMDALNKMVEMTTEGKEIPANMADDLKARLSGFLTSAAQAPPAMEAPVQEASPTETQVYRIFLGFRKDIFEFGHEPLRFIAELQEKGEILGISLNTAGLPDLEELDPFALQLTWAVDLRTEVEQRELEEIFLFVMDDNEIVISKVTQETDNFVIEEVAAAAVAAEITESGPQVTEEGSDKPIKEKEQGQVNTIRVDTRRLENVLNFVAELVISQSKVKELVNMQGQTDVEVLSAFQEVDKIIRRLQEEVMKTSMVPVGNTFTRFQRMVRDTAADIGKDIKLVIHGQETELDKRVIEQINDPLKHMIRNSIDHGIEMPDVRVAMGKPRQGTIWLNASHQEGSIVIEVSDDGQGLDGEKIHKKAVEKGLIEDDQKLTLPEMQKLIMLPGFSTSDTVTSISGRGVGLDVVATNIKAMRGSMDSISEKGKGTKFFIKLPLTLAIIDGMMVTVGEERFIIPLTSIEKFIKAVPSDIKTVEGKGRAIHLRNEYIPIEPLYQLLGLSANTEDPTEGILVIIKDSNKKMALLVDDILGQEQVVTKSLKENYRQVEGVAGATILGDGRVSVILDVPTLMRMAGKEQRTIF